MKKTQEKVHNKSCNQHKKQGTVGKIETSMSLNPEDKLCPKFDEKGIATFELASPDTMGFRVLDNCTEEHIQ